MKYLDSKGREIKVGSKVSDEEPPMGRVVTLGEDEGRPFVEVVYAFDFTHVGERYFGQPADPRAEYPDPHTYTCPDLQLLDDREEGGG